MNETKIGNIEGLNQEPLESIQRKIGSNSKEKRDLLVLEGLEQVKTILSQLKYKLPSYIDWAGLESAGIAGLIDAAEKFEEAKGLKFNTYAEDRIRGSMLDYMRQNMGKSRTANKFQRDRDVVIANLSQENKEEPSEEDIAKAMGLTLKKYREKIVELGVGQSIVSLDSPMSKENKKFFGKALSDVPEHWDGDKGAKNLDKVKDILIESMNKSGLTDNEKLVLELYFVQDMLLKEIGDKIGVNEARVSQIKNKGLLKVKKYFEKAGYNSNI